MVQSAQPNQSLITGIQCLESIVASREPVGVRELARELGLNRTQANRMLMTLAHIGVLERTGAGQYRSGAGLHVLAALATEGSQLLRASYAVMRPWWKDGYALTVGVLWRDRICHVLHARPGIPYERAIGGKGIADVSDSSAGLVLTAYSSSAGDATIIKDGYALARYPDATISIGVPIGTDPILAALAVSKKGIRKRSIAPIVDRLRDCAVRIEEQL